MNTITREQLKEKIDRGDEFVLLEVLSEGSYQRGHLPGAVRYEDSEQVERLASNKDTTVVAYCSNFN